MEEELLRELATKYLVPFFSGARLLSRSSIAKTRTRVELINDNQIGFRANEADDYQLILSRTQPFATKNETVVPEIDVVRAFSRVVGTASDLLETDWRDDVLATFQRKVVARAVSETSDYRQVLQGIDALASWSSRLYEGRQIAASIGFRNTSPKDTVIELKDFVEQDYGSVLSNGMDTILEFDFEGRFVGHASLSMDEVSFCPYRQSPIAKWTATRDRRIAMTLNRYGEILIFRDQQLLFARRAGRWSFLTHQPILSQMLGRSTARRERKHISMEVRTSLYETCLDASFSRTGACLGLIDDDALDDLEEMVADDDRIDIAQSPKARSIGLMIRGRSFQQLDRRLRQEISAIDGSTIISGSGEILAVGAILQIPAGSPSGGRLAAARALSKSGLGIKVSQDGAIAGYRDGNKTPVFRMM